MTSKTVYEKNEEMKALATARGITDGKMKKLARNSFALRGMIRDSLQNDLQLD